MQNNALITIEDLLKAYPMGKGEFIALKDINLQFKKGEFAGLVGPSGSGKTTMLNIIGSLDKPTKGETTVLDKKISQLSHKEAAALRNHHMGFIFQTYNLLPVYTVYENVKLPLLLLKHLSKKEMDSMVKDALDWVGLTDKIDSKPAQLSGGECQRVAVARAMVKRPKLVLADEPTANLDAKNAHNILQMMERLNEELETTFIFATHDEKVIKYLRRQISLEDGRVVADDVVQA
ncbi:MAG: ABC transporter ATP-binding protein [Candidatus Marinimicrobia bacterium]|nr:ABC transporter ATP-binding protein [Candidatus Neomarinimicrobiota bacterium]MCF7830314.1 ABC transporter ATP-binding protein [Candidatus Neomarinimicrobiota bacterium]MCF7882291.1 ABC transporter ATP-binding protein [Candidatus Neomarinimicrobiota bacterium]